MEVDKISKKKRCEERTRCKQVDGGVVQRLAGYLFTGLEVRLICVDLRVCVCVYVWEARGGVAQVRAVITSSIATTLVAA